MAHRPEGFETLEEVADRIAAYQPHRPRPANLAGLSKNLRRMPDGRYRWQWELRQANEILRKASAYFAQAELDRRFKP